eukprot:CAMPEP_0176319214 /NCGR_PEP_ID=MMETSP0121_2-20121125/70184_1 /TAXON_ID=160619 /ORGANISM="Kryptoperidinium foliaceum, Strain CCMP 1326" /LENGTH=71 /DNA_ID=CAMNT_0017661551 /DNA_START=21 /DNA_END=233 /DNA_ORIENTATION=-
MTSTTGTSTTTLGGFKQFRGSMSFQVSDPQAMKTAWKFAKERMGKALAKGIADSIAGVDTSYVSVLDLLID